MVTNQMVKQAYAEGAYQALKEAGYDHQTAEYYAIEMAKQAGPDPLAFKQKPPAFKGPPVRPEPSANPKTDAMLPTAGAGLTRPAPKPRF